MASKTNKKAAQRKAATTTVVSSKTPSYLGKQTPAPKYKRPPTAASTWAKARTNPVFSQTVSGRPAQTQPNPALSLPNGTPTVTPVAPPNIDPFLTPVDASQEAVENGQWDDYIAGLQQQSDTLGSDVALKVGDIDRSLAQGLEATDWNSAARGIQNSSIKDQTKAQMQTQAAATRGAETDKQTSFNNYLGGQRKQVDTVYKPAIKTKYADLAVRNAEAAKAKWNEDHPQPEAGTPAPTPAQAGVPVFTPQDPSAPASGPSQTPTWEQMHGSSQVNMEVGPKLVVKNGGFYHCYDGPRGCVYIRPAVNR